METSKVTTQGQIVIPKRLREKYGMRKGTKVVFREENGKLIIQPLNKDYFKNLAGILPAKGKALKALLEERRKDREREEAKIRRFGRLA